MSLYDWLLLIALCSCPAPLFFCLMRELLRPGGTVPAFADPGENTAHGREQGVC